MADYEKLRHSIQDNQHGKGTLERLLSVLL